MIVVVKDPSLCVAEAVVALLAHINGGGSPSVGLPPANPPITYLSIHATSLAGRSMLVVQNEHNGKKAWVGQHSVSDGITVFTAARHHQYDYDQKRGPTPNDNANANNFAYYEQYFAAKFIYEFLLSYSTT